MHQFIIQILAVLLYSSQYSTGAVIDTDVHKYLESVEEYLNPGEDSSNIGTRSILSEIEDVLAYGHKYQHSFNKRQVNLRNFYALRIDEEKEKKDGLRQGFSKKRLEINSEEKEEKDGLRHGFSKKRLEINPEEKKEEEKYLDEYDYYTDEYEYNEKDEEKQVRELPYKSERGEDKLINHNSKGGFYEPDWLNTDLIGDFGKKVSSTVNKFAAMTIQENGQIETTTSGSRFPYTYVRKSTPKPKPEIVFNFPTAAETKMTDKTTEISEKKTKTGKRRDGGFSSENDFFAELSSLRGNKNELNVVFVDGIPTSQADLLVTTKSPFDVISVNNLLTPDVDEKTRVKLNKEPVNSIPFSQPPKPTAGNNLLRGVQTGMKSLMGNLRNMFGSVTKRMMNVRPSINSLLSSSPSLEPILSNPLPASSHPTANPHPPAVLHTAVHGGDSERSIGIGIRKLETGLIPPRYKQKDISLKEDFFSQEMLKMRKLFPSEKKIDRSGADSTGTRRNTRKEKVSENRNWSFRGNRRSNVPSKIIRGLQRKKEIDSRRNHGEDKKRRVEDTEKSWGGRMDIGENRKQWTDLLMSPTN